VEVRKANFQDITPLVIFGKSQHAKSTFRDLAFNAAFFRRNLRELIRNDNGDALIAVNKEGHIRGLLLAWHEPLLWNRVPYATDLHFVAEQGGDMLLRAFMKWAKKRGCVEIGIGTFNGGENEQRIEILYNRLGFKTVGKTYRMELN
jgi:hypothetical protein